MRRFSVLLSALIGLFSSAIALGQPLRHEAILHASPAEVWRAFSEVDEIITWMVPKAEIDLRIGGYLKTSYDADADLDGPKSIEHRILAFEPGRMLAMQVVRAPADFPFPNAIKHTWTVIRLEPVGAESTRVVVTGLGYTESEESQRMREFFVAGNEWTMDQLRKKFARIGEEEPAGDPMEILGRLVGGAWIHDGEMPNGARIRVRNVIKAGLGGHGLVSEGWLGFDGPIGHHSSTIVARDASLVEPDQPAPVRFTNVSGSGATATGLIRATGPDTVEWDWYEAGASGERVSYLISMRFTGPDAYTMVMLGPPERVGDDLARPELMTVDYDRMEEAPAHFFP
ncbi:MAG: SRPBCC domain-containing protein [Phycisphaerales bacterium]